jgi:hypothetical protein
MTKLKISSHVEVMFWGTDADVDIFQQHKINPSYWKYFKKSTNSHPVYGHVSLKLILPKTPEIESKINELKEVKVYIRETTSSAHQFDKSGKLSTSTSDVMYEVYFSWWPEDAPITPFIKVPLQKNRLLSEDVKAEKSSAKAGFQDFSIEQQIDELRKDILEIENLFREYNIQSKDNTDVNVLAVKIEKAINLLEKMEIYIDVSKDLALGRRLLTRIKNANVMPLNKEQTKVLHERSNELFAGVASLIADNFTKVNVEIDRLKILFEQGEQQLQKQKECLDKLKALQGKIQSEQDPLLDVSIMASQVNTILVEANIEPIEEKLWSNINNKEEFDSKLTDLINTIVLKNMSLQARLYYPETVREALKKINDRIEQLKAGTPQDTEDPQHLLDLKELERLEKEKQDLLHNSYSYVGKNADTVISLPLSGDEVDEGLDMMAMLNEIIRMYQQEQYRFFGVNCSKSVKKILEASIPNPSSLPAFLTQSPIIDTPQSMQHYAMFLKTHLEKKNTVKPGSVAYYLILMDIKLEDAPKNTLHYSFLKNCRELLSQLLEEEENGLIQPNLAERLAEATFNLAVSPTYNYDKFIAVSEEYQKSQEPRWPIVKGLRLVTTIVQELLHRLSLAKFLPNKELDGNKENRLERDFSKVKSQVGFLMPSPPPAQNKDDTHNIDSKQSTKNNKL